MIITKDMAHRALCLVAPTAELILGQDNTVWGPRWVDVVVRVPGLDEDIWSFFGPKGDWDPEWGDGPDFTGYARIKLHAAMRLGHDTSAIVALCPWLLADGENLYPGGFYRLGIGCAASGAMGRVDEAIASLVGNTLIMLAHLEAGRRVAAEEMVI